MGICQIIYTVLLAMNVGISLALSGQPKRGRYSFWTALVGAAIEAALLYYGGFYG